MLEENAVRMWGVFSAFNSYAQGYCAFQLFEIEINKKLFNQHNLFEGQDEVGKPYGIYLSQNQNNLWIVYIYGRIIDVEDAVKIERKKKTKNYKT